MIIKDDIKSLYNQIRKTDFHDQLAFNELAYGRRVADRVYAFCPFCDEILEFNINEMDEEAGRFRLKDTASCRCRKGLRYLRKGILEGTHPKADIKTRLKYAGLCAAIAALAVLGFYAGVSYNDTVGIYNDFIAYTVLTLPIIAIAAGICMILALCTPAERYSKHAKKQYDPLESIRKELQYKGDRYKKELQMKHSESKPKEKRWEDGLHGNPTGENYTSAAAAGAAALLYAASSSYNRSDPDFSYIPDDFEPELDDYDRQALYEDQMIDDWVIASGGNPYDYGDHSDAFTDPFGFQSDFGGGDGGFDGFGGGWDGFGGGDD